MIKKILKENYIYLIVITILTILLTVIMKSSLEKNIVSFDSNFIDFMNGIMNSKLTNIFKFVTNFGDIYIPFIILFFILVFVKNKWYFILEFGGYAISGIITYFAKLLASRPRPLDALIKIPSSFSFPSGHTLTSLVFYVLLCFILTYNMSIKKRRILIIITFIFVLLIAASRVYLGVHYISDIIGGVLIGVPVLLMCLNIINKNFSNKLLKNK